MKKILKIIFFLPIYFKKYVFLIVSVYFLFFTKIFFFVFGFIILPVFDNCNVPMYKFVESPSCQPGGLAYFGDWMLDALQPMVSDEKMIQSFHEHENEMVELAAMAHKKIPAQFDNRKEWDVANARIKKLEKETDVKLKGGGAWGFNPYSIEEAKFRQEKDEECKKLNKLNIENGMCYGSGSKYNYESPIALLSPNFGRQRSDYFCTTRRGNTKNYFYFPGIPPKFQDGHPLDMVNPSGISEKMNFKLMDSTDRHVGYPIMRKITENWYIIRD